MTMSDFTDAVERGLEGCEAPSIGPCPGCEQCRDEFEPDMTMEQFDEAWQRGEFSDEGHFSMSECGICGTRLGGQRYIWHFIYNDPSGNLPGELSHQDDACIDCVMLMCNGDEPEQWER
jgi:hypothetical protein